MGSHDAKFGSCSSNAAQVQGSLDAASHLGHYEHKDQASAKLIQGFGSRSSQLGGLGCFSFSVSITSSCPSVDAPLSILSRP